MSSQPTLLMMQTAPAGGASSFAASINFFIPLILMFGVFWILVFRPQQRRVKEHQAAINAVKKGDEDETKQATRRIRRHDFDSPRSKNGRANLKQQIDPRSLD